MPRERVVKVKKIRNETCVDTPPEFHAVQVKFTSRRKRKVNLVVDDRVASVFLSAREELEPDAPAWSEWGS
jgi:hypothetical protein